MGSIVSQGRRIDALVAGEDVHPVTVRFSHGQALVPLAAFLGIPGRSSGWTPADGVTGHVRRHRPNDLDPLQGVHGIGIEGDVPIAVHVRHRETVHGDGVVLG